MSMSSHRLQILLDDDRGLPEIGEIGEIAHIVPDRAGVAGLLAG